MTLPVTRSDPPLTLYRVLDIKGARSMTASFFFGDCGISGEISDPRRLTRNRILGVGVRNRQKDSDVPSSTESLVTAARSEERDNLTMVCATREPGFQI